MQMKHTVRTAAFFFAGAVALVAQTPVDNQEPTNGQLIALNTTKNVPYFETAASVPNSELQVPLKAGNASSTVSTPPQPGTLASTPTQKPALVPGQTSLAMSGKNTKDGNSWFTSGPNALPAYARMDPNAIYELQRYGAAPVAVQFNFGKK
jgi:hypothetical protein